VDPAAAARDDVDRSPELVDAPQMGKIHGEVAPPLLVRAWNRLARVVPRKGPVYESYDDALRDCSASAYEADELVRVVVDKTVAFRDQLGAGRTFDLGAARTLVGVGIASAGGRLNVLDFGGGGGHHYFVARLAMGRTIDIRWNVVETAAMAREGRRIADRNLKFFSSIGAAVADLGAVDLAFTSGALQYCRDPLRSLRELVDVRARHLFVTRTSFGERDREIVSVQRSLLASNGPGPMPSGHADRAVSYPLVFASRARAEALLGDRYDIRFALTEDLGAYLVAATAMHMYGYYCDLRRA
jgi:putative methyltransferase (TIGR04325 family)